MEPCLFRHGKLEPLKDLRPVSPGASMEPCLFRHGKVLCCLIRAGHHLRFNGAMSFQTW